MTGPRTRCVVADDHPALLSVITTHLTEHDYDVLHAAPDGRRVVEAVLAEQPDVVLVDYRMPYLEGPALLRALHEACPAAKIVVYTAEADGDLWEEAVGAGASALVLKEAPMADVRRAIDAVRAGGTYLDSAIATKSFARGGTPEPSLTPREADVLGLLAEGLSHEEIGARLSISPETVRTHVRKACDRLGAQTRTQAVATALRLRLIT
jgi:DNA-binding NarL/FixJ family response regulator